MSLLTLTDSARGTRRVEADAFPLSLGGDASDVPVSAGSVPVQA